MLKDGRAPAWGHRLAPVSVELVRAEQQTLGECGRDGLVGIRQRYRDPRGLAHLARRPHGSLPDGTRTGLLSDTEPDEQHPGRGEPAEGQRRERVADLPRETART